MDINGKVVLITGASSGIGLATAKLLAQKGAKMALAARSTDTLQQIAQEIPGSFAITADMRKEDDIKNMVASTQEHFGRIDVLINNAGQGIYTSIEDADLEQYRSVFELNVIGVITAMQDVVPLMRTQGGGVIINISSGTTKMPAERMSSSKVAPYASTKYALNALTLAARNEFAPDNIRVGLIYPSITASNFFNNTANGPSNQNVATTGDKPEYVAGLILEAIQSETPEVYAERVKSY